jgi:hypothetical protein
MNIAFPSLLILLILLPGLLFRRIYYSTKFSTKYSGTNIWEEGLYALIPGVILQILFLNIIKLFGYNVNLIDILNLIILPQNLSLQSAISNFNHHFNNICLYNLSINTFSLLIGYLFKRIVIKRHIDVITDFFRFQNEWYYIFEGFYLQINTIDKLDIWDKLKHILCIQNVLIENNVDIIVVDALVIIDDIPIIYSGYMDDYMMDKNGGLERIILKYPKRRIFKNSIDKQLKKPQMNDDETLYDIPGDFMIIPYSKIENMNFIYLKILEEEKDK